MVFCCHGRFSERFFMQHSFCLKQWLLLLAAAGPVHAPANRETSMPPGEHPRWVEIAHEGDGNQNRGQHSVQGRQSRHGKHAAVVEHVQKHGTFCPHKPKQAKKNDLHVKHIKQFKAFFDRENLERGPITSRGTNCRTQVPNDDPESAATPSAAYT